MRTSKSARWLFLLLTLLSVASNVWAAPDDPIAHVTLPVTDDENEKNLYLLYIEEAVSMLDGYWIEEDEIAVSFGFPTVRKRDDFIDQMESFERVGFGSDLRFRDVVDTAESDISGGVLTQPNDPFYLQGVSATSTCSPSISPGTCCLRTSRR